MLKSIVYTLAACDWSKQNDGGQSRQVFVNNTEKADFNRFNFRSLNLQIDNLTRASLNLPSDTNLNRRGGIPKIVLPIFLQSYRILYCLLLFFIFLFLFL